MMGQDVAQYNRLVLIKFILLTILTFLTSEVTSSERHVHFHPSLIEKNLTEKSSKVPVKYGSVNGSGIDSSRIKEARKKSKEESTKAAVSILIGRHKVNFRERLNSMMRFELARRYALNSFERVERIDIFSDFLTGLNVIKHNCCTLT